MSYPFGVVTHTNPGLETVKFEPIIRDTLWRSSVLAGPSVSRNSAAVLEAFLTKSATLRRKEREATFNIESEWGKTEVLFDQENRSLEMNIAAAKVAYCGLGAMLETINSSRCPDTIAVGERLESEMLGLHMAIGTVVKATALYPQSMQLNQVNF